MDQSFWIRELGRLFKRSSESIRSNDSEGIKVLVEDFNEALSNLKEEYPENPIITSTDAVDPTEEKFLMGTVDHHGNSSTATYEGTREEALYEIRSNCERIANSLGYELPDDSSSSDADQMVVVQMENTQSAKQEVSQEVTVESVMELIEHDPQAQANKGELQEITEQFDEELESENPSEDTLRQYIRDAKSYSTTVAAKLSMLALQKGAIGILGL